jgi:hypothetical protein
MWSQPGAKQTPKAFHGVDVYFVDTVSISVAGVFTLTVIDRDMNIAPGWETGVNAVFVSISVFTVLPCWITRVIQGWMVVCWTLLHSLKKHFPPRAIIPTTGGLSFAAVPRPRCSLRR